MGIDVEKYLIDMGVEYEEMDERYMVCCPFHDDSNPSMGIWKDSGYYQCFSGACGVSGSFAEYMSEVMEIPLREAIRKLRGQDSISDLEDTVERVLNRRVQEFKYFSMKSFRETYPKLEIGSPAWNYLVREGGKPEGRKLNAHSIRRFDIRWGRSTGKYRDRVILPIRMVDGKLLSYTGRTIKNNVVPKTKKARTSHRTFYGLYELVDVYGKVPYLVVVEGEFDAIYLQQFGIPAVSNMGTMPLNPAKLVLLRKYTSRVVLSYDSDEAGTVAMDGNEKKKGEIVRLSRHLPVVSVRLPRGKDPNDLSEQEVQRIYGKYILKGENDV